MGITVRNNYDIHGDNIQPPQKFIIMCMLQNKLQR
jgi:hypothetical protein